MDGADDADGVDDSGDLDPDDRLSRGTGGEGSDGAVDYGWVMQVTFVVTILLGVPVVAVLSAFVSLPTWESRVGFAARVGALVWLLTATSVYAYARWARDPVEAASGG